MKKQIVRASALFVMAVILGASQLASARTSPRLSVNVPFDFVAGGQHLPAGRYNVRRMSSLSDTAILIQSADGRTAATVLTNGSGSRADRAQLVFRQYGDQLFLAVIQMPGTAGGREVRESKQERTLRRELQAQAEAPADPKTVTVLGAVQ